MEKRRRVAAYGIANDAEGRVLLVRSSPLSYTPGVWSLPGGGIEHGEDPADAVVREVAEETGLTVRVTGVRGVVSDILEMPWRGVALHTDRVVYEVAVVGGTLRAEQGGTSDVVAWLHPADLNADRPVLPFTAELLGVPAAAATLAPSGGSAGAADTAGELTVGGVAHAGPDGRVEQVCRFAAYGLVTDPAGRLLLTLIAPEYWGAGLWHLPGGGTDYGEQPATAVLRELAEETGQVGRITGLLHVTHRRSPAALGPEGYPIDWHSVRAIYRVVVDAPTEARVTEANGSTAAAHWYAPGEVTGLALTDVATVALRYLH